MENKKLFAGVAVAVAGLLLKMPILFFFGGAFCLLSDLYGLLTGKLKPLFPILFYIAGVSITGYFWVGILFGAILSVGFEVILGAFLAGGTFSHLKNAIRKSDGFSVWQKNKKLILISTLFLVLASTFYWLIYRPEHIRQVCLMAYFDSVPTKHTLPSLPELPSLNPAPNYSSCLRSYGLK